MKKIFSIIMLSCVLALCASSCNSDVSTDSTTSSADTATEVSQTEQNQDEIQAQSTEQATEEATEAIFDVTEAYSQKPYTNEFALQRVEELQYMNEASLYNLCSIDESPIFYDGFFYENNTFNVTLEKYSYDMDSETVRKYFDTYEYSKFASVGALRVVDSFVYDDASGNKFIYYCFYTTTHWSEDETLDTMDYYRDVITVDKNDSSINTQEKIAMVTNLEIPKEITGDHDFHGVI